MRQTTQAVALLLTAANAADLTPLAVGNAAGWQGTASPVANPTGTNTEAGQMSSRTATFYNYRKQATQTEWTAAVSQGAYVVKTDAWSTRKSITGSSCMNCILGNGVWCSATFNFWLTGASDYQYIATAYTSAMDTNIADSATKIYTGGFDRGSCCNSKVDMTKMTGYVGIAAAPVTYTAGDASTSGSSAQATGAQLVGISCVASKAASGEVISGAVTFGEQGWEKGAIAYTGWWCSNGLYKKVEGTGTSDGELNITQSFMQNSNPRTELALVGCPNRAKTCADTAGVKTLIDTTPWVIDMGTGNNDLPINQKCTWVATSWLYAPSFKVEAGTGAKGMVEDWWALHVMEYTATAGAYAANQGALSYQTGSAGMGKKAQSLETGNYTPRFDMPQTQFATLRTWYGYVNQLPATSINKPVGANATSSQYGAQPSTWFAPGQNGFSNSVANGVLTANKNQQFYGNVASIGSSVYYSSTTAPTASDGNYGVLNNQQFDFRTVRYIPASQVQSTYKAGQDLATAYNAKVTSYNTAKTVWNNYVAILAKNAKMDAFAAAFSPPKAPTVPPLPNLPWTPAAYTGGLKQTTLQAQYQAANTGKFSAAAQPASNTWWLSLDAAQSIGGWGSWTAQVMTYRAGWGKSFGTIGFGGGAQTTMNYVWNNDWMCPDRGTAVAQSNTAPCGQNKYSPGSGSTADVPVGSVANTAGSNLNKDANATSVQFVIAVSLWSLGNKKTGGAAITDAFKTNNDLKITFTGQDWGTELPALTSAISYSTAPTKADTLSGIAGAQALAASSAAVLALAALY